MRNKFVLALILLLSMAWAVGQQQSTTAPSAPAPGSTQTTQPGEPGQATPPGAPSTSQAPAVDNDIIEGCLSGAAPNFTVTDKAGTTYKLDIPPGADASILTKHVGESVQVMGTVSDSATGGAAGSSVGATKGKQSSIAVQKIGKGKGTCSGTSTGEKPPSK